MKLVSPVVVAALLVSVSSAFADPPAPKAPAVKTAAPVAKATPAPAAKIAPAQKKIENAAYSFAQKKLGPDVFLGRDSGQNTKGILVLKNGQVTGVRVSTGDNPDRGPQFQDYVIKIKDGKAVGISPKP